MKTPFIFDAVSLILDEWIEDKQCFQIKLFSCLSSPQSWKAKIKVQSAALSKTVSPKFWNFKDLTSMHAEAVATFL